MHPRHTTAMDGGSVDIAGALIDPVILTIVAPARPCARDIPVILTIVAPARPCARDIPVILTIKKGLTFLSGP